MNYDDGYEEGYQHGQSVHSSWFLRRIIRLIFRLVVFLFIFLPLLVSAYWVTTQFVDWHKDHFVDKALLLIVFTYLLYCLIYFFKGMIIALRTNRIFWWAVIWVVCMILTCGLQIIVTKFALEEILTPRDRPPYSEHYELWSWLGGIVMGGIIYKIYDFLADGAPRISAWAYRLGIRFALIFVKRPETF